jgi:hypothetical protein
MYNECYNTVFLTAAIKLLRIVEDNYEFETNLSL